nr:reverse transcriptase domain-containing protein [Tanacetum cinerariifolium]
MLRKCQGHGLTKGAIIQIFYHDLDEHTQGILDVTAGGIFLYKNPNHAFPLIKDKVLFKHDWSTKSKTKHHQRSVALADGSDSNTDNSRFKEKLKAMDSQIISLNEELQDIRIKYNELKEGNASKNHQNDDTPMCERYYIQSGGNKDRNSHDSYFHQSHHDLVNPKKLLTELNNDVRNDLEYFKICAYAAMGMSMCLVQAYGGDLDFVYAIE